jgi:hypothetical protein
VEGTRGSSTPPSARPQAKAARRIALLAQAIHQIDDLVRNNRTLLRKARALLRKILFLQERLRKKRVTKPPPSPLPSSRKALPHFIS